jgi:hypothetical protein
MIITVIPKKQEKQEINWQDLPVGTVVRHDDGVVSLVIPHERMLLLNSLRTGETRLEEAAFHKRVPVTEVLGVITEIIVQ